MNAKSLDEKAVFEVARHIMSEDAREDYLAHACDGERELYDRVCTLLRMSEEDPDFLESPALDVGTITAGSSITEAPGTLVGPYRLIEQIGDGGMGLVFMARQQEPVKRNVALKIIKPGMDSQQVVARFEAERQALALMDHPNIARVLDAGCTDSGRPYFVMDLVKGIPITEYCDRERLPVRQRLELFVLVCQAVQHAHQKGIIHRDIKPGNVLVTLFDGTPVPKVIDFGVAKATEGKLTAETVVTGFAQVIGTPLYMSPEQAELSGLDVDTRTDVYSLGVLLYELLTGTTPFVQEQLSQVSYDEMRRIIREEEAPKPSSRITTMGQASGTVATNRRSDVRTLAHQLKGELDWTVMKAMDKDRRRRYETADALAKDVARYLNHEPVEACPPSALYRFRKFVRRNLRAAVAVAVAVLGLVLGAGVATWEAIRATEAEGVARQQEQLALNQKRAAEEAAQRERELRAESERQRVRAEANVRLALNALEQVFLRTMPNWHPPAGGAGSQEGKLLQGTLDFYQRFVDANGTAPEAYASVEEVYGNILKIQQELAAQWPHVVGYRYALTRTMAGLASLLQSTGRTDEARDLFEQAVREQEPLVKSFPSVPEYRAELAAIHDSLSNLLQSAGQSDRAQKHRAAAEEIRLAAKSAVPSRPIAAIRFDLFADRAGLELAGDASVGDGRLRLVALDHRSRGAAWPVEKQLVAFGFDTVFTFQSNARWGNGLAFVIQNHEAASLGVDGAGIGYGSGYFDEAGIPNSLAVEFDTYSNRECFDPYQDHISVQTNGRGGNSPFHTSSLGSAVSPVDLNDGNVHNVRIRYVPGTLAVFLDHFVSPVLTAPVELSALLDLDRGRAWVGFTSGTADPQQPHDILSWTYEPLVDETAAESWLAGTPDAAADPDRLPHQPKEVPPSAPALFSVDSPFLTKSLAFYRAIAEQNQGAPDAQWEIGKAYWRLGQIMAALGEGDTEEWPREQSEQACLAAARIWQALGERLPKDASTRRRFALECTRRANTCLKLGEFKQALQYRLAAVQLDPQDASTHNHVAWALAVCPDPGLRDPEQAVRSASLAVQLRPKHVGCRNTLGVAHYRAGHWDAAIESLHESDSLEGSVGSAYNAFFLAMAYWQIGNHDEARKWYDQAVRWMDEKMPDDEELLRFRTEAAALLEINETPQDTKEDAKAKGKPSDMSTKDTGSRQQRIGVP